MDTFVAGCRPPLPVSTFKSSLPGVHRLATIVIPFRGASASDSAHVAIVSVQFGSDVAPEVSFRPSHVLSNIDKKAVSGSPTIMFAEQQPYIIIGSGPCQKAPLHIQPATSCGMVTPASVLEPRLCNTSGQHAPLATDSGSPLLLLVKISNSLTHRPADCFHFSNMVDRNEQQAQTSG